MAGSPGAEIVPDLAAVESGSPAQADQTPSFTSPIWSDRVGGTETCGIIQVSGKPRQGVGHTYCDTIAEQAKRKSDPRSFQPEYRSFLPRYETGDHQTDLAAAPPTR